MGPVIQNEKLERRGLKLVIFKNPQPIRLVDDEMSNEYQILTLECEAKTITVYEEPNPKIKELEEVVNKIRELEKMMDKIKQDLAGLRYRAENEITDLMFK